MKSTIPTKSIFPRITRIRRSFETVARFHDCVTAMDKEVGEILRQLDEDGMSENTIVFFYSIMDPECPDINGLY